MSANPVTITVFLILFALVTGLGFVAARWRAGDLSQLHEWGLGGRRFGTVVAWFLLGGDLYTAYTFIAVPSLMFGAGAFGFFAVPYTVLIYTVLFLAFPRLWSVAHARGYVTAADFVRGRFGSRGLALAVALTGILATMPYIALQLVGMQVVIAGLGIPSDWMVFGMRLPDMPLLIAFVVLALYTYSSGLRAPALIAVVKDLLIYATVLAAVVIIPAKLGGYDKIFAAVPADALLLARGEGQNLGTSFSYATLIIGSFLALFLYPHSVTGVLSASSRKVIRRNAMILPAYSFVLALIALLGFMALAVGVKAMPEYAEGFKAFGNNFAVPALFLHMFPAWFTGVAFAAVAIGALVPAAIMSIACANLFTRNIYREFIAPDCSAKAESDMAKFVSLVVKLGALFFVLELQTSYAVQLQLLGGLWMCQTVPAVLIALYTRFFHPKALLAGLAVGIATGTYMAWTQDFKSSIYVLHLGGLALPCYAAVSALVLNLAVAWLGSLMLRGAPRPDETAAADYR
jgi:SSS family solute:Na+ symporter